MAQKVYNTIYEECGKFLREMKHHPNVTGSARKGSEMPKYWEGKEDIEFQQWEEQVQQLVKKLQPLAENLTYDTIKLIRVNVDQASHVLDHRPFLRDAVKNSTLKYLNHSQIGTVAHVEYLFSLENNISYDGKKMEKRYNDLLQIQNSGKAPERVEEPQNSRWFWQSKADGPQTLTVTGKYGQVFTEAYLDYMTERLSSNIYNALCVEILDPLRNQLQKTYTVELFADATTRDQLLQEKSDRLKQRVSLEKKVEELQRAATTLVTSNHTSRDTQRRFREKHKEALLLKNRQYAEKHRDRLAHYRTVYRQENANKIQHQLKDKKERLVRTLTEDAELKTLVWCTLSPVEVDLLCLLLRCVLDFVRLGYSHPNVRSTLKRPSKLGNLKTGMQLTSLLSTVTRVGNSTADFSR